MLLQRLKELFCPPLLQAAAIKPMLLFGFISLSIFGVGNAQQFAPRPSITRRLMTSPQPRRAPDRHRRIRPSSIFRFCLIEPVRRLG